MVVTHGSLFSGMGGFDLAAEWSGWENKFHCEYNEFGSKILKYYWPNAKSYKDIKTTDFTIWRGLIDVISGGFPCQPFSNAGKREGTTDNRFLWPEMFRSIREIQPSWVVAENVPGILTIEGGLVFEQVCIDLENEGYEVLPFIIPACATDADHERERVWFIAYSKRNDDFRKERRGFDEAERISGINRQEHSSTGEFSGAIKSVQQGSEFNQYDDTNSYNGQSKQSGKQVQTRGNAADGNARNVANPNGNKSSEKPGNDEKVPGFQVEKCRSNDSSSLFSRSITNDSYSHCSGLEGNKQKENGQKRINRSNWGNVGNSKFNGLEGGEIKSNHNGGEFQAVERTIKRENWIEAATRLCVVDDGLSGRLDGITVSKWRTESLKAAGNAIRPQVAFEIFQAINSYMETI